MSVMTLWTTWALLAVRPHNCDVATVKPTLLTKPQTKKNTAYFDDKVKA